MDSLSNKQIEAAREFVNITIAALRTEKGVHAETAIAGTARMAGTFLFRSFGFKLNEVSPGQAVFSDLANDQGPRLIQVLTAALSQAGIKPDMAHRGEPGVHQPLLAFLETQRNLEPQYAKTKERLGLTPEEAADAAAVASALLIERCASVLNPNDGFRIATFGFVEGAKTMPDGPPNR